jgi:hypothetical protein
LNSKCSLFQEIAPGNNTIPDNRVSESNYYQCEKNRCQ